MLLSEHLFFFIILYYIKISKSYQTDLAVEKPAALRGRDTDSPSGKFWIPIPIARLRALKSYSINRNKK